VLREHLVTVLWPPAPLPAATKLRLLGAVARWVMHRRATLASEGRALVAQALGR
jgi:hypothetical protein